jgi:hypothetical protein
VKQQIVGRGSSGTSRQVLDGALAGLRLALDEAVATLLQPLSNIALQSLDKCVRQLCELLFVDGTNPMVLALAQSSLQSLAANPLRYLTATGSKHTRIEGAVLADLFRDQVDSSMAEGKSSAAAVDDAIAHVLHMVIERTKARMKEFRLRVLYSRPRKPSMMQQIAVQMLRAIAQMPDSTEQVLHAAHEIRLAVRFLRNWRQQTLALLRQQQLQQMQHDAMLQQQILTHIMRRTLVRGTTDTTTMPSPRYGNAANALLTAYCLILEHSQISPATARGLPTSRIRRSRCSRNRSPRLRGCCTRASNCTPQCAARLELL